MILNFNDVEWEVLDTPIAERFAKFLVANVHETNEFFFMGETLREIKSEIEKIAYMAGWPADSDMNKLHEMFADHPDHPDASRLNDLIHYHELQSSGFPPRWGHSVRANTHRANLEYNSNAEINVREEDYKHFTVERVPGHLYVNYAHVGKHFAEIVFSEDIGIKKDQYHPQSLCRPSFHCWLGPEINSYTSEGFKARAKIMHAKLKTRLNLPDDMEALRLGYIPFAKLKTDININELSNKLLQCKGKNKNYTELFPKE
jgi:hypothetical protein